MINVILTVTNDIVTDNRIHKIATTLCNNGYKVSVTGRKNSGSQSFINRAYRTRRFKLWFNSGMLFYANYNIRLFFYLLKVPVDIIVSNDLDTLPAGYFAAKLRRKQLVFDSHELFSEVPELVHRPLVRKTWRLLEKLLVTRVKNAYTVSKSIQQYYYNTYQKEFELVRNVGVFRYDEEFTETEGKPRNEKVIIYQGAVNVGRGLELVLQALKFADKVKLWVIGEGDVLSELKQLTIDLEIEDKVQFFGRVTLESLWKFTSQADIGFSLEEDLGLNYRYALPNKLFDYIQARIPVIVSDLPDMRNLVENYGIGEVLVERTPEILASQIMALVNDSERLIDYKRNLELAARELCWQREEEKIINMYRKISEKVYVNNG